jgi:hypothetical protein
MIRWQPSTLNLANTADVGYTLNKAIVSGTITYTDVSGIESSHIIALAGSELNQGTFSANELTNAPTLVVGTTYKLTFNGLGSDGISAIPYIFPVEKPFGQFGDDYWVKQWGSNTVRIGNPTTGTLWNKMRAAFNAPSVTAVQMRVIDGTPTTENGSTPTTLTTYQALTYAQIQVNGAGSSGSGGTPNHLDFVYNWVTSYQQLHDATFYVKIT